MPTRLIHFLSLIAGFILCYPVLAHATGRDNYSLLSRSGIYYQEAPLDKNQRAWLQEKRIIAGGYFIAGLPAL